MLFLLDQGWSLLGAILGLALGFVAQGMTQAYAARSLLGDRQPQLSGRHRPDPRRHLDPFGVVATVLTNPPVGWGKAVPFAEPRFGQKGRYVATCLAGSAAHLVLGVAFLAGLRATDGGPAAELVAMAALVNLACAVLRLFPLPPLDGARILFLYAPRTEGWRKARYYLEEQNVGYAILIVLLLPIFGDQGLLLRAVLSVTDALLELLQPVYR